MKNSLQSDGKKKQRENRVHVVIRKMTGDTRMYLSTTVWFQFESSPNKVECKLCRWLLTYGATTNLQAKGGCLNKSLCVCPYPRLKIGATCSTGLSVISLLCWILVNGPAHSGYTAYRKWDVGRNLGTQKLLQFIFLPCK